ncbi:hypothetical protein [Fuerstiella marisgermanici]|uniref:Uncharacterized protein n=1 Tax=Fuerstiella marisgermanici TaxID=1891926 RepID=A0A1P8WSA1_9PLAN|nr:hypothetical protein [Fuerstiella marisgermanici]APZ96928.1 hypothetical protein Fuma_06604 [Fuerstiella marisgermanici]
MISATYPQAFLNDLPQHPDNYNPEDLADMFAEWNGDEKRHHIEAAGVSGKSFDELAEAAVSQNGHRFSDLACRVIAVAWSCCELNQVRLVTLFKACIDNGLTRRDVLRAIGEMSAVEAVYVEWCDNAECYFLTLANMGTPNQTASDIVSAWEDVREELNKLPAIM